MPVKKTGDERRFPDVIYIGHVASLYTDRKSVMMGLVNTSLCGIITIYATGSALVAGLVALMPVIGAARLRYFDQFANVREGLSVATARSWEKFYTIGASCYLATLGVWTFCVFAASNEAFPTAIALGATISSAFGIPIRNFAFARGAFVQMAAVAIPLFAMCAWLGSLFWLLGLIVLAPTFLFMKTSAVRLRNLLFDELLYRQKSEETAHRLDMAVNSMTLGLCMLSPDCRVVLANGRFRDFMGLPQGIRLEDRPPAVLLRAVRARGMFSDQEFHRLRCFAAEVGSEMALEPLQIETVEKKFFEISVTRSDIGNSIVVVQDITDRRIAERAIDRMAWFDTLTGLPNRRSFDRALHERLTRASLSGGQTAVLFIDVDDFKQVNDTLGHRRGDAFLIEIANRLLKACGPGHLAARWGGDEFVVLSNSLDALEPLARSIIESLSQPCVLDGYEVAAGASVGIATTRDGEITADALLQHADMALYAAKSSGRNRWRFYNERLSEAASSRRTMERDVRAALNDRLFELHFQPIVDLKSGKIVSFEALARWNSPGRGPVPPSEFVPMIEELGLVIEFGQWVLESACQECAKWPDDIRVGVNLSALQIRNDPILETRVLDALRAAGLSPKRLELEITETILLEATPASMSMLERLRALGVRIALDDFGTGYSSLSYLMSVPLDKVKIDRSFVGALGKKGQAGILVDSVAKLGAQLGMSVTAEGIETEGQLEFLRAIHHVAEGQGYFFGKPVPAPLAYEMLQRERPMQSAERARK